MKLLQLLIVLTIVYAVYVDQAYTNIPGYSIIVYFFMNIVLLYYNFKLRLEGGLFSKLSYECRIIIVFFSLIFIPGLITSTDSVSYLHSIIKGIEYAVLFISVYYVIINKKNLDFILLVLGVTVFAYALTTYFMGTIETGTGRLQISGRGHSNELAQFMYYGFILAAYFWNKGFVYKMLTLAYTPIAVSNMILSGSRKGFIGIAIFLVLLSLSSFLPSFNRRNIVKRVVFLIVISIIAISVYNVYSTNFYNSVLFQRLNLSYSNDESANIRAAMYVSAFDIFREYPIFGVGYDNFKFYSTFKVYSHSTYTELLSCTGIVGALIFLSIYVSLIYKLIGLYIAKMKRKLPIYTEGIFLSYIFMDLILATTKIDLYDPVVFVLFGCMAAHYKINQNLVAEFESKSSSSFLNVQTY